MSRIIFVGFVGEHTEAHRDPASRFWLIGAYVCPGACVFYFVSALAPPPLPHFYCQSNLTDTRRTLYIINSLILEPALPWPPNTSNLRALNGDFIRLFSHSPSPFYSTHLKYTQGGHAVPFHYPGACRIKIQQNLSQTCSSVRSPFYSHCLCFR